MVSEQLKAYRRAIGTDPETGERKKKSSSGSSKSSSSSDKVVSDYVKARRDPRYKTDPEYRQQVEKFYAFKRAGISVPVIPKSGESEEEALKRSATKTAKLATEVTGKDVKVTVSKTPIQQQKTEPSPSPTNNINPEAYLFPTYGIPSLERRNQVLMGAVSTQKELTEQEFGQRAMQLTTTPGNIVYSKENKTVAVYSPKERTLFYTEEFRPKSKPKSFTDKVLEGGSTAMLAVGVSNVVDELNTKLGSPLDRTKFRFGQSPTYEEALKFTKSTKDNPLLYPVKIYEEFSKKVDKTPGADIAISTSMGFGPTKTGRNIFDIIKGGYQGLAEDPLGSAAIVGVGAGAGGVVGTTSKVVGGLPFVQKAGAVISKAPLPIRTIPKGLSLGGKTILGATAVTATGVQVLTNENPSEELGRAISQYGLIGTGFRSGYTFGQRLPGAIKSQYYDLRYKGRLSTDLPMVKEKGSVVKTTKDVSTDVRAEVQEIKNVVLGQAQTSKSGVRYGYVETGEKQIIPINQIPRGDAVLLKGNINRNVNFRYSTPQDNVFGVPSKSLVLRKPSDAFFTASTSSPYKAYMGTDEFNKVVSKLPVLKTFEGTGVADLTTRQSVRLSPKLIKFSSETGLTTTSKKPFFRMISQGKPLSDEQYAKAAYGFLDVKGPMVSKPPSVALQEIFREQSLAKQGIVELGGGVTLSVKPKPVFKIIRFKDVVKPDVSSGVTTGGGTATAQQTVQILKEEVVKEKPRMKIETVSKQKQESSLMSEQKTKTSSEAINEEAQAFFYKAKSSYADIIKQKSKSVSYVRFKDSTRIGVGLGSKSASRQSQNILSKQVQSQMKGQSQVISQAQKPVQIQSQGQAQGQFKIPSSTTSLISELNQVNIGRNIITNPRPKTPKTPKLPKLPFFKFDGSRETFSLGVRRQGVFRTVGTGSFEELSKLGKNIVEGSAAASLRITKASGETLSESQLGNLARSLGGSFRPSKSEGGVFVERRSRRIKSSGELQEITFKGIRSRSGRGLL